MSIEGDLTLSVDLDGRRVERVSVHSTRPFAARRILANKSTEDATALVPLLFSLCRRAQSAAAAACMSAASGNDSDSWRVGAQACVGLEVLQEHVSHLLLDVPRVAGREAAVDAVAEVRKRIDRVLRGIDVAGAAVDDAELRETIVALAQIAAREIFAMPPSRWFSLGGFDELTAWAAQQSTLPAALLNDILRDTPTLGASDVRLMSPSSADMLSAVVIPALRRDADFARAPTWNGAPAETGSLARMREHRLVAAVVRHCGNGVAARLVARLVELASLLRDNPANGSAPEAASIRAATIAPGEGVAAVQTARGLLLHRVRVGDRRVIDYQIVAPTEWNFHPHGALPRGLVGMIARDQAEALRQATLVAQTLDPCVAFRIEVGHA